MTFCTLRAFCVALVLSAPPALADFAGQALGINAAGVALPEAHLNADNYFLSGRIGRNPGLLEAEYLNSARWDYGGVTFAAPVAPGVYDVEIAIAETFHKGPGRRVMDVAVEGEVRIADLDPFAAAEAEGTIGVTRMIEGVNPATSGDPGSLEIEFITKVDAAAVATIRIFCADRAADCAEQRVAHLGKAWQGVWSRSYTYALPAPADAEEDGPTPVREVTTTLTSTSEGVLVDLDIGWLRCEVVFSAGVDVAEMAYRGDTCVSPAPLGKWALRQEEQGRGITLDFVSGDRPVTVALTTAIAGPTGSARLPEARALDLAGVTLASTVSETMEAVTARFAPRGSGPAWRQEATRDGLVMHHFESAEGVHTPVERFVIIADGAERSATPIALLRRWVPQEDDRPLLTTVYAALEEKYGAATRSVRALDGNGLAPQVGLEWLYDLQGQQRLGEGCIGTALETLDLPPDPRFPDWARDLRDGCGYTIEAIHGPTDSIGRLVGLQMLVTDVSRMFAPRFEALAADNGTRIEDAMERHAARLRLLERLDAILPRL